MSAQFNAHGASLAILYIGHPDGTSLDRANALRRLGHRVEHLELRQLLPPTPWIDRVIWKLGGQFLSPWILRALPGKLKNHRYDLCYVDSGEIVTPGIIKLIRQHATKIVNYNIDDPFGKRDVARFAAYRLSVPYYDLCVVVRSENVAEAERLGAKDVMRLYRSSDEIAHASRAVTARVPLTIRGANWQKAREWAILKPFFKGGQLKGDNYALALQCAKVNLGLLSKGNRDLHTTRSLEIPALGALLCAERTDEHLAMYREGEEALFWDSADECAKVCLDVLRDEERRKRIAAAGLARSIANGNHNENAMNAIITRAFARHEPEGRSAAP